MEKEKNDKRSTLEDIFSPTIVAIIGASQNKVGGIKYYFAMESGGFLKDGKRRIFLINPKFTELYGMPVYPSIKDPAIPKPIDLAIIAVPAPIVPSVIREGNKIVKYAVIFSSGFGEAGRKDLERDLKDAIAQSTTKVIGPNCLGVMNPEIGLMIYPDWERYVGSISYVAMSGGTMARLYFFLGSLGLGFRHVVSIGNSYGLSALDFLEHFESDPKTQVIALYLESVRDGRRFMEKVKEITPKKPIILWKGGQTERGITAAYSHTGGLAGSYQIWKAMTHQTGILLADHFELFLDLVQVATIRPIPPENLRVAIIVAGGGIGVEFTDNFEKEGIEIPELSKETQERLAEIFPPVNTSFKNPVDLGEYGYVPKLFAKAMDIIIRDSSIGSVVFVREPERFSIISKMMGIKDPQRETIETLTEILKKVNKPVFCNPSVNSDTKEAYNARHYFQVEMIKAHIPVINYMKNIPKIIKEFHKYGKYLKSLKTTETP